MVVNSVFDEPKQENKTCGNLSPDTVVAIFISSDSCGVCGHPKLQTFLRTQTPSYLKLLHPTSDSVLMWRILSEFCSKVPLTHIDSMSLSELENTERH